MRAVYVDHIIHDENAGFHYLNTVSRDASIYCHVYIEHEHVLDDTIRAVLADHVHKLEHVLQEYT